MSAAPQPTIESAPTDAAALFRAHGRFVARILHRAGVPKDELEDLVQDAFLVVHRHRGFVPGPAKPTTWLAQIALRIAANHRRKRRAVPCDPAEGEQVQGGLAADSGATLERAQAALWSLDEGKRLVFMLFELEGVPCDEIAASLAIPVGTVYSRLTAARAAFVAAMTDSVKP